MSLTTESALTWRKSSFSDGGNGACVEVAWPQPRVAVRDSKHPIGRTLSIPRHAWAAFLQSR
jgi:hypothetical protein